MRYLSSDLKLRINNIGKLPICNLRAVRAPHIYGYTFILCWRCTAILLSYYLFGFLLHHFLINLLLTSNIIIGFLMCLPTAVDGILQYYFQKESNNQRRIITGISTGMGLSILMNFIF